MKLFIIGKNGQVGKDLQKHAKLLHFTVTAYGKEELDICNYEKVAKEIESHKPDVVINASAYHVVPDCETYPDRAFAINTLAVKNLADVCEKNNIRLVHYSTDYVFDGLKRKPYKENDRPHPLQVYGISKLAGEYAVLTYCRGGIIIRAAYVYGGKEGSRSKKGNFVLTILRQAKEKSSLEVSSDLVVSPTYSSDLAKATLHLIQQKKVKGIYHFVNEGFCSLADFAKEIVKASKIKCKIIPVTRGGKDGALRRPVYSVLYNSRARKMDITLPPWENAVKRYIKEIVI